MPVITAAQRRQHLANAHARYFSACEQGFEEDLKLGNAMAKNDSVKAVTRETTTLQVETTAGIYFEIDAYGNIIYGSK